MPPFRTLNTPYGRARILAVREGRVYFDGYSSASLKQTIGGVDYAVSLGLTRMQETWASDDGRGGPAELSFVVRPVATKDSPATDVSANHAARQAVIGDIQPIVSAWADDPANADDFLAAEEDALTLEIARSATAEGEIAALLDQERAWGADRQAKLDAVQKARGGK